MKKLLLILFGSFILFYSCDKIEPPDILVKPTTLNFGEIDTLLKFKVINEGDERLDWNIDTTKAIPAWVTINPMSGINETSVSVIVRREGLPHGSYSGSFHITSNGGEADVDVIMIVF
ncbi:MAG: hypothetical protein Kow0068_01960 [Marinilabiliales bacterium]